MAVLELTCLKCGKKKPRRKMVYTSRGYYCRSCQYWLQREHAEREINAAAAAESLRLVTRNDVLLSIQRNGGWRGYLAGNQVHPSKVRDFGVAAEPQTVEALWAARREVDLDPDTGRRIAYYEEIVTTPQQPELL